ncbi:hypothetical protein LGM90_24400 [Burkholderia sp. AU28942]|uniref:hypothetical protein n=1 Tax=Burkholderia TaxID=32008 RepID=UPI0008422D61|nr:MULTISPECIES: hypothetical protein [Burkholderia]MBR7962510.1 hypothetical protein [Burkholderia vietnamiensis]AOK03106.1 hypothetical protein WK25_00680 [Burkholderia latens]MBY4696702.1 hypothetical protein [Burkholderia latens]MCA8311655.1 hypothetical protein [Burkholderia sp. AU28942]QTO43456.1 hypothetical protein J8I85_00635 [Burkholderia latens]
MTATVTRCIVRLALVLVATAFALVLLFLIIVGIARYERDEGSCPDAPAEELEAKILAFAKERGVEMNEVEFIGKPRYYADKLGWWAFDLKSRDGNYAATIDCDRRITGFGKIQKLPLESAKPAQ